MSQAEVERFRETVAGGGNLRDYVLFAIAYYFGLRSLEVTYLRTDDVDLTRQRVLIRRAKGGESKWYPLPGQLVRPLRRYLRRRRKVERGGPFLFVGRESNNQTGISRDLVQKLFRRYALQAGLSYSSKVLRHSIAVHALEAGYDLSHVADLLGHKSVRSTAIYARVSSKARDAMIRSLDRSEHVVAWR